MGSLCGAGFYGTSAGAAKYKNGTCAGACTAIAGNYCPAGSSTLQGVPCAIGSFCLGLMSQPQPCTSAGYWCPPASFSQSAAQCQAGQYGTSGGAVVYTSGLCGGSCIGAAGSYCPAASTSSSGVPCPTGSTCAGGGAPAVSCNNAGFYCAAGGVPTSCSVGYFGTAQNSSKYPNALCEGPCTCSPGYYCAAGSSSRLGISCLQGSYCPGGSSSTVQCQDPGHWCAPGATSATSSVCGAGYYGTGALATTYSTATCAGPCTAVASLYCPAGSSSATGVACPSGSYCTGNSSIPQACTCAAGAYCGPSSALTTGQQCPAGRYCTGGSTLPAPCTASAGSYCGAGSGSPIGQTCSPGQYCAGGSTSPASCTCAAGYFCGAGAVSGAGLPCSPLGSFCAGSTAPATACSCTAGNYCGALSSSSVGVHCPAGSFCLGGSAQPALCTTLGTWCPAGTGIAIGIQCDAGAFGVLNFAASYRASNCSGQCTCQPGYYCPAGSTSSAGSKCPIGNACSGGSRAPVPCSTAGYYCPAGSKNQTAASCAPGAYGTSGGAGSYTSSQCAGVCTAPAGSFCPSASDASAGVQCMVGYTCAGGANAPVPCAGAGYWCPRGASSESAVAAACNTGYYGTSGGASSYTSGNCGGPCTATAGNYCPSGSQNASGVICPPGYACTNTNMGAPVLCTQAGSYCPAGSTSVTASLCQPGYYGTAAAYATATCAGLCQMTSGNYCPSGSVLIGGIACPAGYYCMSMSAPPTICAAGTFGLAMGLSTPRCSGSCAPGFWCPPGSTNSTAVICPPGTFASALGSTSPACQGPCTPGYYCVAGSTSATQFACPAGRFGGRAGESNSSCAGVCAVGYYCPAASTNSTSRACAPGSFGSTSGLQTSACSGLCAAGRFGTRPAATSSACEGPCALGYYCVAGSTAATAAECAPGTLGNAVALTSAACGGACPLGSFCIGGTAGASSCSVGGFWCPIASVAPNISACDVGSYGTANDSATYTNSTCAGACHPVPGRFCPRASSSAQGDPCPAGFACPSMGAPVPCGSPGRWCPTGTPNTSDAASVLCAAGYYGTSAGYTTSLCAGPCTSLAGYYCPPGSMSLFGAPCPVSSYCTSMATPPVPCPPGRFGATLQLTTSGCSGPCNPGYWCAVGSTTATAQPCPSGRYASNFGSSNASCDGLCTQGYYCPAGTAAARGQGTPCPAGVYGNITGLGDAACRGACPRGYFCGVGTINPLSFPCPTGSYGAGTGAQSVADCKLCPGGTYGDTRGASACKPCPPGSFTAAVGSVSDATCNGCGTGFYGPSSGARSSADCFPCPIGTAGGALAMTSASQCPSCGLGTYNNVTGAGACTLCPLNTYGLSVGAVSLAECTPCPAGMEGRGAGATALTACTACAVGHANGIPGQACAACSPGKYANKRSALACDPCPRGTSCPLAGANSSAACGPCGYGEYSSEEGAASCAVCATGSFGPALGAVVCELCPGGTYNALPGATAAGACTPCFDNRFGQVGSSSSANCSTCQIARFGASCASVDAAAYMLAPATVAVPKRILPGGGGGLRKLLTLSPNYDGTVTVTDMSIDALGEFQASLTLPEFAVPWQACATSLSVIVCSGGGTATLFSRSDGSQIDQFAAGCTIAGLAVLDDGRAVGYVCTKQDTAAAAAAAAAVWLRSTRGITAAATGFRCSAPSSLLTLGDLNGDGFDDLLCGRSLEVATVAANGTAAHFATLALPLRAESVTTVGAPGDCDGDGIPDILVGSASGVFLMLLQRTGVAQSSPMLIGVNASSLVSVGDTNNDGITDFVWGNASGALGVATVWCPQCARAVAFDSGQQPGIGAGDTILLQFPCKPALSSRGAVVPQEAVDLLAQFSASIGSFYTGTWSTSSSLVIQLANITGVPTSSTRIGALRVALLACAETHYLSVAGSWGTRPAPRMISAVAADTGRAPGLSSGDTLVVKFDSDVGSGVSVIGTNTTLGATTSTAWLDPRTWQLTVRNATGSDAPAITRVGRVRISGSVVSADLSSPRVHVSMLLSGSWGDFAAPIIVSAVARDTGKNMGIGSGDTVLVTFDSDTSTPVATGLLQFNGSVGLFSAAWQPLSQRSIIVTIQGTAGAAAPELCRVGTQVLRVVGDLRSPDLSSPPSRGTCVLSGTFGNAIVAVSASNTRGLSTSGGEVVTLALAAGLGASGNPVSAAYSNGPQTYFPVGCAVTANGAAVQCYTVPGVGVGFSWTVVLDGIALAPTKALTSYGQPVIVGVTTSDRSDATPEGGQLVVIEGRNFGPLGENAVSNVFFYPRGFAVDFIPFSCAVTSTSTKEQVTCTLPPAAGANYVFSLEIGGQVTTDVFLPVLGPVITSVDAPALSTAGGDAFVIHGRHFGVALSIPVQVAYGAGLAFQAPACNITAANVAIRCVSAPGYGSALLWQVTVLGTQSAAFPSSATYAAPQITYIAALGGALPTSGGRLAVSGTNFASAFPSIVVVEVDGLQVLASSFTVTNDTQITIDIPVGSGLGHTMLVIVGSQPSNVAAWSYGGPELSACGLVAANGSALLVQVNGKNFGADTTRVRVVIGNASCIVVNVMHVSLRCWTREKLGLVSVSMLSTRDVLSSDVQTSRDVLLFDAHAAQAAPFLGGAVVVDGNFRGGGTATIAGANFVPNPPAVIVLLRFVAGQSATELCERAQNLASNGVFASDFCVSATVQTSQQITCVLPSTTHARAYVIAVSVIGTQCVASPSTISVTYDAPSVLYMIPAAVRTDGGQLVALWGRNFDNNASILINGFSVPFWVDNSTFATLVAPSGDGTALQITILSNYGQRSLVAKLQFLPPRVTSVFPLHAPAAGGTTMLITGADFGDGVVHVRIGNATASVVTSSHSNISCLVSAGVGENYTISVAAASREANYSDALFSYDAPVITSISGAYINCAVPTSILIEGASFGPPGTQVSVVLAEISAASGGVNPCDGALVMSDTSVACTARVMVVGVVNVDLSIARRSIRVPFTKRVACGANYFGRAGDSCQLCPPGALCVGDVYDPVALAGFTPVDRTTFAACIPAAACDAMDPMAAPNNGTHSSGFGPPSNCASGYAGVACRLCAKHFRRSGAECIPCPANAGLLAVLFVAAILLIGCVAWWLHDKKIDLKGVTIGIDLFQILSMFESFQFHWPPAVKSVFTVAGVSAFSVDLIAPECTISFTFSEKWFLTQLFPFVLAGVLLFVVVVYVAYVLVSSLRMKSHDTRAKLRNGTDFLVEGCMTIAYYSYFVLLRNAIIVFACMQHANGVYSLNADPSITCWAPNGEHATLLPWAISSLVVVGAGVPAIFAILLRYYKLAMQRDQRLWLLGRGGTAADNPDFVVRRRFSKLYQDYNPDRHSWRLVLLVRKMLLVLVSVLIFGNALFQASCALAVLSVAFGFHARFQPFVSSELQDKVLAQSLRGVVKPRSDSAASRPTGRHSMTGENSRRKQSTYGGQGKGSLAEAAAGARGLQHLLDLNVLETMLLCCCLTVLVGGMMFESAALAEGGWSYILLTVVVDLVIILCAVLFFAMLAMETRRTWKLRKEVHIQEPTVAPDTKRLSVMQRLRKLSALGRQSGTAVPGSARQTVSAPADFGAIFENKVLTSTNPLFRAGGQGSAVKRAAAAVTDPQLQRSNGHSNSATAGPNPASALVSLISATAAATAAATTGLGGRGGARWLGGGGGAGPLRPQLDLDKAATRIQTTRRGSVARRSYRGMRMAAAAAGGGAASASTQLGAVTVHAPPTRASYVSPTGWRLWIDEEDGDEFYYNAHTMQSQHAVPADYAYTSESGWTDYVDEEGDRFYVNVLTNATTFELPPDHV